jgi:hypothetical protein
MKARGPIRTAVVLAILLAFAVFFGLAGVLGPPVEPGPRARPGDPGVGVYVLEDGGYRDVSSNGTENWSKIVIRRVR